MPTYDYTCTNCQYTWEEEHSIKDEPTAKCPKCEQETAQRQISLSNFILKGKWFKTGGY